MKTSVTWKDIGGLEGAKNDIKTIYGLALCKKQADFRFTGWRRVLLYGPPGTGKTLMAAAISSSLNAPFFNVRASNILSKWVGDSPKIISTLFQVAREEADVSGFSVIFFDEFDALGSRREGDVAEYVKHVVATLLVELDGLAEKDQSSGVLTIAATNLPGQLDDALLSRFQKRIYIPLPDRSARKDIVKLILSKRGAEATFDHDWFAGKTEYYGGRDIERVCQEAVNIMVTSHNKDLLAAVEQGEKQVREYELKVSPITKDHMEEAMKRVRVDVDRQKRIEQSSLVFGKEV